MGDWRKEHPRLAAVIAIGLLAALLFTVSLFVPVVRDLCTYAEHAEKPDCPQYHLGPWVVIKTVQFLDTHGGAITAIATIWLAYITWLLVKVTGQQAEITKEARHAQRASVFPIDVGSLWEQSTTVAGQFNWRLRPIWRNSGSTPTRQLRIYSQTDLLNYPMPAGFNFSQIVGAAGTGLLAPNAALAGGHGPGTALTPQELLDVQHGRRFLYMWGWARYYDIFENTEEHITRFCFQIFPLGNPLAFVPNTPTGQPGSLTFPYIYHTEGNCADDECD